MAASRIYADNARIDYENLQIEIKTEVKQAIGDYKAAIQQVETSDKGLVAAQSAFDIINGRYSLGASNYIELANAQINLLQAEENKVQSRIGLMLQKTIINFYLRQLTQVATYFTSLPRIELIFTTKINSC